MPLLVCGLTCCVYALVMWLSASEKERFKKVYGFRGVKGEHQFSKQTVSLYLYIFHYGMLNYYIAKEVYYAGTCYSMTDATIILDYWSRKKLVSGSM